MSAGRGWAWLALALLLAVGGGYLLLRRGVGGEPAAPAVVAADPAVAAATAAGRPVLFVGLDGADWELLDDYMARGWMPNLEALVREGRRGVLLTEEPTLSPLLWTTMMTGSSPLEHRILDFAHYHPLTGVLEPISSSERRRPAIWNMATYGGKSVAVFGQWATYPAEEVNGVIVSDRLFTFLYQEDTPPPRVVHPAGLEPWARRALAEVEAEVDLEALRAYLPWLDDIPTAGAEQPGRSYDDPVSALRRILVETRLYHRLATDHIARHRPDLTVLYLQGTDSVGHIFAPFAPPRQASVSESDFERYRRVPELYFQEIDSLLADYRRLAGELGAVLVLASDHGFLWSEGRPASVSSDAAETAAQWHRREGIYLVWGLGPAPTGTPARGGIRQICASLLALLGLPDGVSVAAPPLAGIAPSPASAVDYGRLYEPALPATSTGSAEVAEEELAKLRALGYLGGDAGGGRPDDAATLTAGASTNEARILIGLRRYEEAERALSRALRLDPERPETLLNLGILLAESGRLEEAIERLRAATRGDPEAAQPRFNLAAALLRAGRWQEAVAEYDELLRRAPGYPRAAFFRATALVRGGRREEGLGELRRLLAERPADLELRVGLANELASLEELRGALAVLEEGAAQTSSPAARAQLDAAIGRLLVSAGRYREAAAAYRTAVERDPMAAESWVAEARALVRAGDWAEARRRLEEGLARLPQSAGLAHVLARLLVSAPDPALRDGRRALELADGVFRARDSLEHGETVAMALAESGRFDDAVALQKRLIESARQAGQSELVRRLEPNLERYRRRQTVAAGQSGS